ncbi:PPR domain-containing protein/PPR_3 domain-containing protein [Cephalotus follicularis]|uniref:PPR domain-containing protein/PPR_3 domain-containing protein n=1 Tax=Cephalotus follicularis TaxID=3775 RepID=A0A1Q3CTH0_CEPFO|nr:PPR domain-containing protein/PPR_3 domain-containing protein [Cephalotus follicularis]
MEAAAAAMGGRPLNPEFQPDIEKIKRRLLKYGVHPTPKIIHTLRKKEIQKHNRRLKKLTNQNPPLTDSQNPEESHFLTLKREYKEFVKATMNEHSAAAGGGGGLMVGKPWERIERVELRQLATESKEFVGDKLKRENLKELKEMLEGDLRWVFDDDIEVEDHNLLDSGTRKSEPAKPQRSDADRIRFLVDRLSEKEVSVRDWKLARMMKQSGLQFTEIQLLKIVDELGVKASWRQALAVVEWIYDNKEMRHFKSRFVYTKLLSVLGKAGRPQEALRIFNMMLGNFHIYPDIAAYHSIAVTLGQAGLLKELISIIDCMRQKPSKRIKSMHYKKAYPVLEPDLVVYNAVLNACVPCHQWKGVSWVFEQLRKGGLRPNGATYGLAMEVMLQSGKYDLVHKFFEKMKRSGEAPKALTHRVLVKALWMEGKVSEAVEVVRDMEQRGVVGIASVYYELACCLCNNGRWQDAMMEVEKMKRLPHAKPLEVTFTGMIQSSMDGGHVNDCICIFKHMKDHCSPNIGTINAMLKIYGQNDMFSKARELFEKVGRTNSGPCHSLDGGYPALIPDEYTYRLMLEASASALQWEYFEYVYKEMILSGYQIDPSKYASLLVRASRAGKYYLLEHAFDAILGAGEIPHPIIFTEMIFQAAAQNNYERAAILVNSMAHAPFQVSERQWTDLFEKSGDRISRESLEQLLDALGACDVASEATVSNLSKSLRSLSRFGKSRGFSNSSARASGSEITDNLPLNGPDGDGDSGKNMPHYCTRMSSDNKIGSAYDMLMSDDFSSDDGEDDTDTEMVSRSSNHVGNKERQPNLGDNDEAFAADVTYGGGTTASLDDNLANSVSVGHSEDVNNDQFEIQISETSESNLPSAYKILESWKVSREKDGIFFPFQLDNN